MTTLAADPKEKKHRVGIMSLGCPKTLVDSELILGKLDPNRYTLSSNITDCDIAMINTCAFIRDAQEESIDQILSLIELKKEGQIQKLVVLGCLPQRFPEDLKNEFSQVDAFVGSGEYAKIPQVLQSLTARGRVSEIGMPGYLYTSAEKRVSLTPAYYRYLKISEGCDHVCSFCVIPQFRGKHRSRELEDVVLEAEKLAEEGCRELILTGQDTTFFGYDLQGRYLLPDLLSRLNEIPKLRWIRILYAYPSLVSDTLIHTIASLEKVCHYLDVPLQHVNDRILKSMRRGVTKDSIRRLVKKLRREIPDLSIRTTFIVGYPGETEAEFQELLDFMEETHFERLGIFVYSQESDSPSALFPGQIPSRVKKKRLERGMLLQQEISRMNNGKQLGKTLEVLLDGTSESLKGHWEGRSYLDAPEVDGTIYIKKSELLGRRPGDFVHVKIAETRNYDFIGTTVSVKQP